MKLKLLMIVNALLLSTVAAQAADDIVIADFNSATYDRWTPSGTAFGNGPVHGQLPDQQKVDGYQGDGYVNSYRGGDSSQGTLESFPFIISRPFISFLIGGGNHPGKTCINLLVLGKIVATATGQDDEHLDWYTWDVKAWRGQQATIEIVDKESSQWGHINVDQIIQTDKPVPPLQNQPLYHESLRPQFHFSSATNWINDPNGLVYNDGEYHLFFQHNPSGINWGNMTWGHAVSPDLVHWTQLPDALKPDELGTMFSGSAVVDWNNTSGFGRGSVKPMVAMYTAAGGTNPESKGERFSQCIAFSNDRGRTWTKYANNPVIPHIVNENRDPKLVWYAPDHKWIVAIYKDGNTYALFTSTDLKNWTLLQDLNLPGCSECPDFFPMKLDGDPGKTKWVFTAADGHYLVGDFDGKQFTPNGPVNRVDFGRNYYAVQTFADIPKQDGRRIQIAWMRDGKYPRMPFNGQMSFPAEMELKTTADGPRIFRTPIREIEKLQGREIRWNDVVLDPGKNPLADMTGDLFHIRADIKVATAKEVGFKILGQTISYSTETHELSALGEAQVELENGHLRLEILVDRTTIETFANNGRVSFTSCYLPHAETPPLEIFAQGGTATLASLSIFPLNSAWPTTNNPVK